MNRADIYRRIVESAADYAIIGIDRQGNVARWNPGAERVLGWTKAEILGRSSAVFLTLEDQVSGRAQAEMQEALEQGSAEDERWLVRKDGSRFWAVGEMFPLSDDDGSPIGFLKILRDRTPQHKERETLQAKVTERERLWLLSEDLMLVSDFSASILSVNPAWERTLGWSEGDLLGQSFWPIVHPDDRTRTRAAMHGLCAGEPALGFVNRLRHKDGTYRWLSWNSVPGDDRLHAVGRDISEQKRAEEEAWEKATLLKATLENMDQGLICMDASGHLTLFNRRARELLDLPIELLASRPHYEEVQEYQTRQGEGWPGEASTLRLGQSNFTSGPRTYERARPNGTVLEIRTVSLPDGGAVRTYTDITTRRRAEADLRASEERYRLAAQATNDAIWDWDLQNDTIRWGDALEALFGYTTDDIAPSGAWWKERIHPDDRERVFGSIQAAIDERASHWAGEYRFQRADGSFAEVFDRSYLMCDAQGEPLRIVGAMQDQTERKRAEATLRDREERLRALVEAGVSVVWTADPGGQILSAEGHNKSVDQPLGEYIGEGWIERVHPEDRPKVISEWLRLQTTRETGEIEYRVQAPDGEYYWVHVRSVPLKNADGSVREWVGTLTDISERKRAEETLQLRDRALEAIGQGVVITDPSQPDNPIIYVNPAFEALTGYTQSEVLGRNCRLLQGPDSNPATASEMGDALRQEKEFRGTILNYRKDGRIFTNEVLISPVRDAEGKVCHFVGTQLDISQRMQMEEQLRQSQKMEAVGQLTGGIAHDFNNLLTVILGNSELLIDDPSDPALTKSVCEMILDAAQKGADLTKHLLAFGRRQTLKPERLNLDQVVEGMEPLLRRAIRENIEIVTELREANSAALTDRALLESAILNLVVNARDAMPEGGTLTITTGERFANIRDGNIPAGQSIVFVTVKDTGTGISPEVLARVFEPFFTTKGIGKGTGLGLSMVYGFAQQAGGHVSIQSMVGQGTTATILLPAINKQSLPASDVSHSPAAPCRGERVLVVEDEPQVRHFVCAQLTNLGYSVESVSAGPDALNELRRNGEFDLLFTDVVLPKGMSGVELARLARQIKPGLKVLLSSGYAEETFEHYGRPEPDMLLLRKPYKRRELAETLRMVLE